jgi:hypothetical protein
MPTSTYDLIGSNVLASSASTVTFSSIPSTYQDLILVVKQSGTDNFELRLSGISSGVSATWMSGYGTSTVEASGPSNISGLGTYVAADFAIYEIFDYLSTNKHKTALVKAGTSITGTYLGTAAGVGRWATTSAVSTLSVVSATSFAAGNTFYLYGIVG